MPGVSQVEQWPRVHVEKRTQLTRMTLEHFWVLTEEMKAAMVQSTHCLLLWKLNESLLGNLLLVTMWQENPHHPLIPLFHGSISSWVLEFFLANIKE